MAGAVLRKFTSIKIKKGIAMNLKVLVLTLLLGITVTACNQKVQNEAFENKAAEEFKWKLVTSWPKNYPGLGTAPEKFAEQVNLMSNGRLQVKVYGAGELVPAMEVFDAVSQGTVEMGHSGAYYWKGKIPAAQFFTTIPFGLTAQEINGWLYYGGGMELWEEIYEPYNLIPLAGGNTGVQMAGWFNKEINSVADLKGLKMRIPGIGAEVLNRLGGEAISIPGGELFTALQTGVIDATEWVGPWNDLAFGFYKVAEYYYYPGWHEPGSNLEFIINKEAFNSLPSDLQAIVKSAARSTNQDVLNEFTAKNNMALQTLINEHSVKVKPLPKDVIKALHKTSNEVINEFAKKDPLAEKVQKSFIRYSDSVKNYHKISEQAYLNARDQ